MGLDAIFQAIPDDEEILELAKADSDWMGALLNPEHYRHPSPLRHRSEKTFLHKFDVYYDKHVEIFSQHLNWGRKWDMLTYLLVSGRRVSSLEEVITFNRKEDLSRFTNRESLIYRAIMGGDWLLESRKIGRAIQCEIPRYLLAADVQRVAETLNEMTIVDVLEHYDDNEMDKAHIYKFHPHQKNTQNEIIEAFEVLRNFYLKVSYRRAGVLHCLI